jgi:hypothetical protein
MPYRTIPNSSTQYALIAFDGNGLELSDADGVGGCFSARIFADLSSDATTTDVFLLSHGWMGDIPAAIDQYDRWIGAMEARDDDKHRMSQRRLGFKPLRIGVHWPSKPWGDEELGAAAFSLSIQDDPVNLYLERLGDRRGCAMLSQSSCRRPRSARTPNVCHQQRKKPTAKSMT